MHQCDSLISVDLSNFTAENDVNMNYMFNICVKLISFDISNFHCQKGTNMNNMFSY